MILTKEQKKKYMESGGGVCPVCGSQDISGGFVEVQAQEAWQNVSCSDCGESWRDVYKLAFVETDEELDQQGKGEKQNG
jgi:formate dehydrogenase maturation protein FdhE